MLLLALESSCDETSAAVVRDGRVILSNIVASQIDVHAEYGGVVPELASRKHLEAIGPVIDQALSQAGVTAADLEGVCVTRGPGLIGALLVGLSAAKAFAFALGIPWVGLHHMEGHILAPLLEQEVPFPFLALAVSGAHTHIYRVEGIGRYTTLGRTLDDAAGEAYDKVAKLLGLGYPGGAVIERLAAASSAQGLHFPRPLLNQDNFDFSFSGIKTAVLNHVRALPSAPDAAEIGRICAAFQEAVTDVLTRKTMRALEETGLTRLVVGGGVACNRGLQCKLSTAAEKRGVTVRFPSPRLCGDNGAMLAVAGDFYLSHGICDNWEVNAVARWKMDDIRSAPGREMIGL
ncbi:MAG: tRNA (adenosine(37)-N6)-threonylcarbamoyltransferase complex transferase subunit TsaD [Deltaproteobacteria bacterium]|nr:tRNA (adenosine(37)-N6)-threonylcarbamoyltransferase complex transferase subunit TsaD [Deltaproteobacteria bacterium]